jgi:hypothetical protein
MRDYLFDADVQPSVQTETWMATRVVLSILIILIASALNRPKIVKYFWHFIRCVPDCGWDDRRVYGI